MYGDSHGQGCTCTLSTAGLCTTMFCNCIWHGNEIEVTGVPFSMSKCMVCFAVIFDDWSDLHQHMKWHEKKGDLSDY